MDGEYRWEVNNELLGEWSDWMDDKPNNWMHGLEDCVVLRPTSGGDGWDDKTCNGEYHEHVFSTLCEQQP